MSPSTVESDKSGPVDISKLRISSKPKAIRKKVEEVAESWEDEIDSEEDGQIDAKDSSHHPTLDEARQDMHNKKPIGDDIPFDMPLHYYAKQSELSSRSGAPEKRPEKTTAVANRIIAAALGVRHRPTEEQRKFQKSQLENEKKRLEDAKRQRREEEKLKESVWND